MIIPQLYNTYIETLRQTFWNREARITSYWREPDKKKT